MEAGGKAPKPSATLVFVLVGLIAGAALAAVATRTRPDPSSVATTATAEVSASDGSAASATDAPAENTVGDGAVASAASPSAASSGGGGGRSAPGATAGSAASGSGAAPAAASPAGAPAPAAAGPKTGQATGAAVRGVTASKVVIGIAALDIGALRALGPSFDIGDREKQFRAVLDGWKRAGLVPVHGRDVEFVVRSFGVLDEPSKRSACVALLKDAGAFAVIGDGSFGGGVECVAREHKAPLVMGESRPEEFFQRNAPYLFTLQMNQSHLLRNWMHWAHRRGTLNGKRIGIYYFDDAPTDQLVRTTIEPELAKLGHKVVAKMTTRNELGGPEDLLAVQRFQTERVDLAILLRSKSGFMRQAEAQRYKPTYIESDMGVGTSDTTTSTYPPEQWDGTEAMTGLRYGEVKSNLPLPKEATDCVANYARFTGVTVDPRAKDAEWGSIVSACDLGRVVLHALQKAGPALNESSFIAGLETIRSMRMGLHADVTFTRAKHHGADQQRSVKWFATCKCWKVTAPFSPLLLPA